MTNVYINFETSVHLDEISALPVFEVNYEKSSWIVVIK